MKPIDAASPAAAPDRHGGAGHHKYSPEELHNVAVAHEHSDINVRAIVGFLAVLAAVCAGVGVLMWLLFLGLERSAAANDPAVSPVAAPAPEMPARTTGSPSFGSGPQPRLLTNEPAALAESRAREDLQLGSYGWVDEAAGVARMPIEDAKKLLAERGVPARGDAADPRKGTHSPAYGDASSGRTITRR